MVKSKPETERDQAPFSPASNGRGFHWFEPRDLLGLDPAFAARAIHDAQPPLVLIDHLHLGAVVERVMALRFLDRPVANNCFAYDHDGGLGAEAVEAGKGQR